MWCVCVCVCEEEGCSGSRDRGRTVVSSQEGGVVHVVLDVGRLAVQDCGRGDAARVGVDSQPVGRVVELGVPEQDKTRRFQKMYEWLV